MNIILYNKICGNILSHSSVITYYIRCPLTLYPMIRFEYVIKKNVLIDRQLNDALFDIVSQYNYCAF